MKEIIRERVEISRIENDHPIDSPDGWNIGTAVAITTYWSGESAPPERHAAVRMHWSETALYVRFDAAQKEPLIVSQEPKTDVKTPGLWDRDVCEIFVATDVTRPGKYFEFEVAPTGEWVDLAIETGANGRTTDLEYPSNFESFASIENDRIIIAMRIGWEAFGKKPSVNDVWLGNLFRCVGKDPTRGYLAWQPTFTELPNFHVPESFGEFVFV